ncbi:MAG: hypothetical protein O3A92_07625 [Verrucomicrobia bacterium]|nr:hypothetical protein [Verrucomicrobiota bacterium]
MIGLSGIGRLLRMGEFALRPKAVSDTGQIWDYTVEIWDEEQAERHLRMRMMMRGWVPEQKL